MKTFWCQVRSCVEILLFESSYHQRSSLLTEHMSRPILRVEELNSTRATKKLKLLSLWICTLCTLNIKIVHKRLFYLNTDFSLHNLTSNADTITWICCWWVCRWLLRFMIDNNRWSFQRTTDNMVTTNVRTSCEAHALLIKLNYFWAAASIFANTFCFIVIQRAVIAF